MNLQGSSLDLIYVDGDHSYEGCTRDIAGCMHAIKPGGIIIFNDYVLWSIAEFIDYGVAYAVVEFLKELGSKVEGNAMRPCFRNDIAIKVPEN